MRMGIVLFAGEAFQSCPLTADKATLLKAIEQLEVRLMEDGTALNLSLLTALASFDLKNRSQKNIILFTDGVNNISSYGIPHQSIAEIACAYGVSIQSIGIGSQGKARAPIAMKPSGDYIFGFAVVEIDEARLKSVSEATCGSYNRVSLMEKTDLELKQLLVANTKAHDNFPMPKEVIEALLIEIQTNSNSVRKKYFDKLAALKK